MSLDLTHPTKYVFHFTTRDILLERILSDRRLKLGQIGKTNDPRETQERSIAFKSFPSIDEATSSDLLVDLTRRVNRLLRDRYLVLCTTRNDPDRCKQTTFCHGYSHARMWAHYGGNHSGGCLILDRDAVQEALISTFGCTNVFSGPVNYADGPKPSDLGSFQLSYPEVCELGEEAALSAHVGKFFEGIFLRKAVDWVTEWEYRWICRSEDPTPAYISIEGILRGVIVGVEFPEVYFPTLRQLCEPLAVQAGYMRWPNGHPVLWPDTIWKPDDAG